MRATIIYLFLLVMPMTALQAQERKQRVAVFDPTSSGTGIDEGTKQFTAIVHRHCGIAFRVVANPI